MAPSCRSRLRAASGPHRRPCGTCHSRAATARRRARQCLLPLCPGRRGCSRQSVRGRGARRRLDLANNRLIGAAIEPRAVLADGSAGQAHALLLDAGAASHPPRRDGAARPAADRHPPDRARCRRRLRLQGQALSRRDHHRLGGPAAAAAGEMGRQPQRMLPVRLSRPRPPDPLRTCARHRGTFPCLARRYRGQYRRLCFDLRRWHPQRDLQRTVCGSVPYASDLCAVDRRVHQHSADRCLSRRWPPRGLLCPGTLGRRGGAQARHRSR